MHAKRFIKAVCTTLLCIVALTLHAQQPVTITPDVNEHIFHSNEIEYIEDTAGSFNIQQISSPVASGSSVPAWPILARSDILIWFTASNDVHL